MDSAAALQAVNLAVILLCIVQRIPQVSKVIANGSTLGLDVLGLSLELWCFLTVCNYAASQRYPFLTYCEDLFLSAQGLVNLFFMFSQSQLDKTRIQIV
uniref:PQ-loop repeat-containing protein 3 n=1 Tax=Macrostomum lignano TaxID=282301 RepID=A0A1I8HUU5_9PLAT